MVICGDDISCDVHIYSHSCGCDSEALFRQAFAKSHQFANLELTWTEDFTDDLLPECGPSTQPVARMWSICLPTSMRANPMKVQL